MYPIIKIPEKVKLARNAEIPVSSGPWEPFKPERNSVPLWVFLPWIFPMALLAFVLGVPKAVALIFMAAPIGFWVYVKITSDREYSNSIPVYQSLLRDYQKRKKLHDEDVEWIRNPLDTEEYQRSQVFQALKKATKPYKLSKTSKKGASEDYFFSILKRRFPGMVYQNQIIEEFESFLAYQPDIIYNNKETNLLIDIEIDEPYILETREPIHYINKSGKHTDEWRDSYFNAEGWFVIRFSEEQVVNNPEECCNLLEDLILRVEKNERVLSGYAMQKINTWNFEEAENFSQIKYREGYLKKKGLFKEQPFLKPIRLKKNEPPQMEDDIDDLPF
ncbi:MAG: DUF559 domain-containing protein [Bacteroidia bacterium]|nr:DUF559 domain-containing protein [Bacteroidia bacterium]